MNQASATKLIPKLRFKVHDRRKLCNPEGPQGRHNKIRKTVTALFRHERLELNYNMADESRGYAERLIADAIKYGDCHKPTMDMASYWILEKQIIHKLFKVLVPRYQNTTVSYTKLWKAPKVYPGRNIRKCVLELRDNIYPPLGSDKSHNKNLIHNVLLEAAKNAYRQEKAMKKENEKNVTEIKGQSVTEQCSESANVFESKEINAVDKESEFYTEENLQAESVSKSEIENTVTVDSSTQEEMDLSKMNITEEKPTGSQNKVERDKK